MTPKSYTQKLLNFSILPQKGCFVINEDNLIYTKTPNKIFCNFKI